jgi:hypothetical protein
VEVSIDEAPGVETTTDTEGNFELDGDFSGPVTLRFRTPTFEVVQPLAIPTGAVVVLADVELRPDGVELQAGRQLGFVGRVQSADCAGGTLIVADRRRAGEPFVVALLPETAFQDRSGAPIACETIEPGAEVGIDGLIAMLGDRDLTALTVTVEPEPETSPRPEREVAFVGRVVTRRCEADRVVIDDGLHRSRLRLSASTSIRGPDGEAIACADVRLGDRIVGRGLLRLRMPGLIDVELLQVVRSAEPGDRIALFGFVAGIDCEAGTLDLVHGDVVLTVHVVPATAIEPPLQCEEIRVGDRVAGVGRINEADPERIDALILHVRRRGGP